MQRRANFAKALCKILNKHVEGQLVVAGGLVRDLWAAQVKGVDMYGSGDIDILLIGNSESDLQELAEAILDIRELEDLVVDITLTRVDYSCEKSEAYPDAGDRLHGVIQFRAEMEDGEQVEIDILDYATHIETLQDALDTFNCNVNKFWFDEHGNGCSLFDGSQPFEYREDDREKNQERYEKCVMRYNLVAKAAHPYQRIDDNLLLV